MIAKLAALMCFVGYLPLQLGITHTLIRKKYGTERMNDAFLMS